jgi:hypothetical protein
LDDRKAIIKQLSWGTSLRPARPEMCEISELRELSLGVTPMGFSPLRCGFPVPRRVFRRLFSSLVLWAGVANGKWHIESHYPTQAKVRLDPDFLPRCAREGRVCAFH